MRILVLLLPLTLAACASETEPFEPREPPEPAVPTVAVPTLETRADSVAWRVVEASGGLDAWAALSVLRFEFGVERDGEVQIAARHLWEKSTGRYRVEWPGGGDTTYVALFTAWPDSVRVYADGARVRNPALAETARRRTINDTYWLLAPLKLFDPGVRRTYIPDSSTAEAEAIRLDFEGVGMTPGDRYWLFVDRESGRLRSWSFVLQDDPARTARSFRWTDYESLRGLAGPVVLSARKEGPGGVAILTGRLRTPDAVHASLLTDPNPRL